MTRPAQTRKGAEAAIDLDHLVTGLLNASRALVAVSARSIARVEETLTLAQFRTLVVLDTYGEINLLRLSDHLDVNSSTAMRMIDRLLAAGLVTRRENPGNRREVLLGLTRDGARIVRQVTSRRKNEIARIAKRMPSDQLAVLVDALQTFSEVAQDSEAVALPPW